jgi:hypothetical protein
MNEEGLINGDMTWLCLIQHSTFHILFGTIIDKPNRKTIRNSIRK